MQLPNRPLPTGSVLIADQVVEFRALSRSEATHLSRFQDEPDEAEPYILAAALSVDVEEARSWLLCATFDDADRLLTAIIELSGLPAGKA